MSATSEAPASRVARGADRAPRRLVAVPGVRAARVAGRRAPLARTRRRTDVLVVAGTAAAVAASGAVAPLLALVAALALLQGRRRGGLEVVGLRSLAAASLPALGACVLVAATPWVDARHGAVVLAVVAPLVATVLARLALRALHGPVRVVRLVSARPATEPTRPELTASRHVRPVATLGLTGSDPLSAGEHRAVAADVVVDDVPALVDLVADLRADAVALAPGALSPEATAEVGRRLGVLEVPVVVVLDGVTERRVSVTGAARYGRTLLTVAPHGASATHGRLAEALDRTLAAVLLVLALPLLAVLALAVRLDSAGPALFHQERIGRDGRRFVLHKLRTMHVDAERALPALARRNEVDGALFKIRADPRVTRVGRLLRRSSLDELPQLWNVVRGDMSLVGPRPALPHEVHAYEPAALRRLAVKPGITGPWQVRGRSDLPWSAAVDLDVAYADNHSIAGDLVICAQTVSAVVRAKGAY